MEEAANDSSRLFGQEGMPLLKSMGLYLRFLGHSLTFACLTICFNCFQLG